MKRNIVLRIAAVVLMCTLVTACFASSTFAKYTASATGKGAAVTVAKWSIKAGQNGKTVEIAGNPSATFDIAQTLTNTVKSSDDKDLICPGSSGSFSFVLTNDSQVAADYVIELNEDGLAGLADVITIDETGATGLTGTLAAGASKTVTVAWSWPYSTTDNVNDGNDTTLGMSASTYTFNASITVTQHA